MSRFLPADHSKGDERTIGGYAAVHARPAAFEGRDGYSYSVEILADRSDDAGGPFGAFFLFVRWKRFGEQAVEGHLESSFLAHGADADTAKAALGAMMVEEVQRQLDALIAEREQVERAGRLAHAESSPSDEAARAASSSKGPAASGASAPPTARSATPASRGASSRR